MQRPMASVADGAAGQFNSLRTMPGEPCNGARKHHAYGVGFPTLNPQYLPMSFSSGVIRAVSF